MKKHYLTQLSPKKRTKKMKGRFVKGSKAAKAFMKKLRAKRK